MRGTKFFVGAAALAAATAFSGTASAANFPCSASPSPTPGAYGSCVFTGSAGVGFNILGIPGGTTSPTTDVFTLNLGTASTFTVSFTAGGITISSFTFNGNTITSPVYGQDYMFSVPTAGFYNLSVDAAGTGSYTGSFALAVPEPATWGMMIAGFALGGMALRRRRKPLEALA